MPAAALAGLYTNAGAANRSHNTLIQHLQNSDIKKLISVLRTDPSTPGYWNATKHAIHELPHYLRSSALSRLSSSLSSLSSSSDQLCKGHSGLNSILICDIWDRIKHEFDKGIGRALYPVVMFCGLTKYQAQKVRQLEPVLRMWHHDFTVASSTPQGHTPIKAGEKWAFQANKCPACILCRLGANQGVVFALLAGIVASYSTRVVGTRKQVRSNRAKWVRYWLKAFPDGNSLVEEAWDLGEEFKRLRKVCREHQLANRGYDFYGFLAQLPLQQPAPEPEVQSQPQPGVQTLGQEANAHAQSDAASVSDIDFDISYPFDPTRRSANPTSGDTYAPSMAPIQRTSVIGFDNSDLYFPPSPTLPNPNPYTSGSSSLYSRYTNDSLSPVPNPNPYTSGSSSLYSRYTNGSLAPFPIPSSSTHPVPPLPHRFTDYRPRMDSHLQPTGIPFSSVNSTRRNSLETPLVYSLAPEQVQIRDTARSRGVFYPRLENSIHSLTAQIEEPVSSYCSSMVQVNEEEYDTDADLR